MLETSNIVITGPLISHCVLLIKQESSLRVIFYDVLLISYIICFLIITKMRISVFDTQKSFDN